MLLMDSEMSVLFPMKTLRIMQYLVITIVVLELGWQLDQEVNCGTMILARKEIITEDLMFLVDLVIMECMVVCHTILRLRNSLSWRVQVTGITDQGFGMVFLT